MSVGEWDRGLVAAILVGYLPALVLMLFSGPQAWEEMGSLSFLWGTFALFLSFAIYALLTVSFWFAIGLPLHRVAVRYCDANWLFYISIPIIFAAVAATQLPLFLVALLALSAGMQAVSFRWATYARLKP